MTISFNTADIDIRNPILDADSYKFSHYLQDPDGTKKKRAYLAPRYSKELPTQLVMSYGNAIQIKECLMRERTKEHLEIAEYLLAIHGEPFNKDGFRKLNNKYGSSGWPLSIKALPEGTLSPVGIPQVVFENTDDEFGWVTTFLETTNLRGHWYPSSVATLSKMCVDYVRSRLIETSGSDAGYQFKVHDFGGRAATCLEHAGRGSSAHLINSRGTDTLTGILYALKYYNGDIRELGFSIPAAEHATVCSFGLSDEAEIAAYAKAVDAFGRKGSIFAVVSDYRDIYRAVEVIWGEELREKVMTCGGTLVIRPDSGDPLVVLPQLLEIAAAKFGFRTNDEGFKVLNDCVRFIWGDGINFFSLQQICDAVVNAGWSIENVAFGMGGALLNSVERDTFGYAMKACWVQGEGFERDIYKDPVTDRSKASLKGRVTTWTDDNGNFVAAVERPGPNFREALVEVYRNGDLLVDENFGEIRNRADSYRFF